MTPEAQRIAIAEACGWHSIDRNPGTFCGRPMGMKGPLRGCMPVPDYLNDLNAMHEAESVITDTNRYIANLRSETDNYSSDFVFVRAAAAQRAKAFLRTIGKWQDSTEQKGDGNES